MNNNDSAEPDPNSQSDPVPSNASTTGNEHNPRETQPEAQNTYQKFRHFQKVTFSWAKHEWKRLAFHERVNIFLTGIIAFVTAVNVFATVIYVGISIATLQQVRKASVESGQQMDRLIEAAQFQARASNRILLATKRQSQAANDFAQSADQIRSETQKAVIELGRAADDSEQALRISQRAYIVPGAPTFDSPMKTINFAFTNMGHIPSGPVELIIYAIVFEPKTDIIDPNFGIGAFGRIVDRARVIQREPTVPPQSPISQLSLNIGIPKSNAEFIKNASQMALVVGTIRLATVSPIRRTLTLKFVPAPIIAKRPRPSNGCRAMPIPLSQ